MQQDDLWMSNLMPAQDREVRALLDSGDSAAAEIAFARMTDAGAGLVGPQWNRSLVLVQRALMAWRLGKIPLALELAAEGWTELDIDNPRGAAAAHAVGTLGYLYETIGHRKPAVELLTLSTQLARESGDPQTLAYCLIREASTRMFHVSAEPTPRHDQLELVAAQLEEAQTFAKPGQIKRTGQAALARVHAALGHLDSAEQLAAEALAQGEAANDWFTCSVAHWSLTVLHRLRQNMETARHHAAESVDKAEKINEALLVARFSRLLATICAEMGDPVGEAAALRRTLAANTATINLLQEGLGQALEQRRVAVQASRMVAAAHEAAQRDALTGLHNRLGLERNGPPLLENATANGRVPWLLLIDIDYFKEINDQAGHSTGDVVLQEIAHLLRRECRSEDLLCRWAGDEFIVLIGENSGGIGSAGTIVARRIQDAVRSHDWRLVTGRDTINPTVSIGVAAGPPASVERLFQRADTALYRAKAYGRNTVEVVIRDSD